jgi:hypothetical protein
LAMGNCPLAGCPDSDGNFKVYRNHQAQEAFECDGCGQSGDLGDFMDLLFMSGGIEDVRASEVTIRPVEWEWHGRIPKGKLAMFDGDPDLGKSVVTMDIAARKSTGRPFPDNAPCQAGNVLIVNVEDGVEDTIVPRLKAHGANTDRVYIFQSVPDGKGGTRLLDLPQDLPLLEELVRRRKAELLIIDPVLTMLGGDANKDQDARKALTPLRDMAERTNTAVICVRHLNKSVGLKAIQRGGGNMGLIGVARAGSFFAEHPDDDRLRVMAAHKSNLAEKPPSLTYRIGTSATHDTARVEWMGVTDHDANSLANGPASPAEKTKQEEAKEFLRDELGSGPMWAKQIFQDARDAGISQGTLYIAKSQLRVRSEKVGTEGWQWALPKEEDDKSDEDPEPLEPLEPLASSKPPAENLAYLGEGTKDNKDTKGSKDPVADGDGYNLPAVRALLADPPKWLPELFERCRQAPGRYTNSTANSIATEIYGSPARWREVLPVLEEYLEGRVRE